jgi:hypothetical protein
LRVIVVDADGVLHPSDVRLTPGRLPEFGPGLAGHHLFEHTGLLADMLKPHPDVRLLLSTSWVQVFGYEQTLLMLPGELRMRVIGSCFDPARHGPGYSQVARGYQVLEEVRRRELVTWVALDDDARGWPEEIADHLIRTDPVLGLASSKEQLELWLAQTASC